MICISHLCCKSITLPWHPYSVLLNKCLGAGFHYDMTVVPKTPCSDDETQNTQHNSQSVPWRNSDPGASTDSGNTTNSGAALQFHYCFSRECYLHSQIDQAQHQTATDLLSIGTVFDFHRDHSNRASSQSSQSNTASLDFKPQVVKSKLDELLLAIGKVSTNSKLPIERWLAEEREDRPFNAIEDRSIRDFMFFETSNDFGSEIVEASYTEGAKTNRIRLDSDMNRICNDTEWSWYRYSACDLHHLIGGRWFQGRDVRKLHSTNDEIVNVLDKKDCICGV